MEHDADVFSREPNGLIALRITEDEWDELLLMLRCGFGSAGASMRDRFLRLVNRLNTGNPEFIPYEIPATEAQP